MKNGSNMSIKTCDAGVSATPDVDVEMTSQNVQLPDNIH